MCLGFDPTFSLDPADPRNPRGEWLKAVYRPEKYIAATHFGDAMFRADWLLKHYSFGVTIGDDGKMLERHCGVDGFKSTKDIALEREGDTLEQERWSRFWIVSDKMVLRRGGDCIYFDTAKMRVKTMRMVPTPSGLKDVPSKDDPVANAFAENFTQNYDEIAKESPVFEEVKRLAKAVALAKWLKELNIPIDMSWVAEHAGMRMERYVDRVPALSVEWKRSEETPFVQGNRVGYKEDGTYAESESVNFEYGTNGVLKKINGESIGTVEYSYSGGKVTSVTTPRGELQFVYGEKGNLKRVRLPGELSVDYSYVGAQLRKLELTRGEHSSKYIYENGFLVSSTNFAGGTTKYKYEGQYPKSVTVPAGLTTEYSYDKDQIKQIHLPDGRRITYEYNKRKHRESRKVSVDVTLEGRKTIKPPRRTPRIRQVEKNTDEDVAVLLVNKRGSRKYMMKFGLSAETPISSDIETYLDIVFGKRLGNRDAAKQRLKASLSSVANDRRTVIVWTPGKQFGHKLSLFLTKHMGVRAVVTDNPIKARENLTKHQPVGGNTSLVLVYATMLKAQREAISREVEQMSFPVGKIARSLQDIPVESNIVVVVAENNPRDKVTFFRQLQAAGKAGKLKDKFIVLQYCGESKPEVAKKILDHGAAGVFFYERKIFVPAVRLILREADKMMQEKPWMKADEVFRYAIQRVIDGIDNGKPEYAPYKHLKRQLEDMLNNFTLVLRPTDVFNNLTLEQVV